MMSYQKSNGCWGGPMGAKDRERKPAQVPKLRSSNKRASEVMLGS
jgi:hypothetical protein